MKTVSCPIFDGHEYPKWKAMMKKRLMAMNRNCGPSLRLLLPFYAI